MTYVPIKELHVKQKQDKFLKEQLEKEREQQLLEDIERTEKERVKKKGLKVLKQSGVLDGYQYLLTNLCQYGLPTGDLYEFSALTILRYEKKLKATKKKELQERLKQRTDANSLVRARGAEASPPREEEQKQEEADEQPKKKKKKKVVEEEEPEAAPKTKKKKKKVVEDEEEEE